MRGPYTFSVLRYIHDVMSGEFINIGVAIHAPEHKYFGTKLISRYSRISSIFPDFNSAHFLSTVHQLRGRFEEEAHRVVDELPLDQRSVNVTHHTAKVLPKDDSSLQFSPESAGMTSDPEETLVSLFDRYVMMYWPDEEKRSRSDADVGQVFSQPFRSQGVLNSLKPKTIHGENLQHRFDWTWTNGVVNIQHPLSFDLVDVVQIPQKAANWSGRLTNLADGEDQFKITILLGAPKDESKLPAFIKAQNILNKIDCEKEFVKEEEAESYAANLKNEIHEYMQSRISVE